MSSVQAGRPIVLDNGSGMCKAGFSGDDGPKTCFPAIVGCPKYTPVMTGIASKELYIGEEAMSKKGMLSLQYPLQHGVIQNWDAMTSVWQHCFCNELRVMPSQHPCLLTEAPMNPKDNREKMTEIFFETFNVPAFYLSIQAVLSLYSSGKTTGIVLDSGDGVTHTVPIYQGYSISHAIQRNNLAGRDLNNHMQNLLTEIGINFHSAAQLQIIRNIKQKLCYIAIDYEKQVKEFAQNNQKNKIYELPDGKNIEIADQMIRCPEALFKPQMLGKQLPGFHQILTSSIQKCDIDIKRSLYDNIVLSGGTTLLPGIQERLTKQLAKSSYNIKPRVIAAPERKFLVWIGGSILTELSTFQNQWITKSQFQETGASIVHRKCF